MLKVLLPLIGALAAQTLSPTQLDLAAGVAAGVAALSARLEAVEARLARYEGGASAAAAVAGPTPTTPATRRPLKVAPTSSKAGDLPGMELHNSVRTSCPYVRFSYHCKGPRLPAYAAEHARSLTSTLAAARGFAAGKSTGAKNVVFLGNSHTGQLGETLLCALHHLGEVAMFEGTDLNTGCLMKQRLNATCNGSGKPNACGMYIAKVVTKRNTTIYVLNNHPWLFQGAAGWNALTEHVGIDWAAVGKVVLGPSNAMSWTTFFSSPPDGGYPRPQVDMKCSDRPGVTAAVLANGNSVMDLLVRTAFRGLVILAPHMWRHAHYQWPHRNRKYPFTIKGLAFTDAYCYVGDCAPRSNQHPCLAGYPLLVTDDILRCNGTHDADGNAAGAFTYCRSADRATGTPWPVKR